MRIEDRVVGNHPRALAILGPTEAANCETHKFVLTPRIVPTDLASQGSTGKDAYVAVYSFGPCHGFLNSRRYTAHRQYISGCS